MKEIFNENKESLLIKMEAGRVEEITLGCQAGSGQRLISKAGHIDYDFKNLAGNSLVTDNNWPVGELVGLVRQISRAAKDFHREVRQVKVSCRLENQQVVIKNLGNSVRDNRRRYYIGVEVVAQKGGRIQKAREVTAGSGPFKIARPAQLGEIPARRACLMLEAPAAPAGRLPVVLAGEAGGTMIHEACGHGLEADFIAQKISRYSGCLKQKVASEKVTVIDDPSLPGLYGSYKFDDEGTPAGPVVLIEKGILKNYLTDRYYSKLLKISTNGHGRRQSYRSVPIPRMANTFVAAGTDDPQEMVRSLKKGVFVKKFGGGQVDVVSGDFVFEIEEGYLVINGKIKHPVRQAILAGNGPQVLKICDAVGPDLQFSPGICGKDDQAPVTSGQPTLRIPEILVGGMALN